MSKTHLLLHKKNNPITTIINRTNQIESNNKSNHLKPKNTDQNYQDISITSNLMSFQNNNSKKLYTFCATQNKSNISFSIDDQINNPIPIQRQRKVSISNIRGKIYHPKSKSKQKLRNVQNMSSFIKNSKKQQNPMLNQKKKIVQQAQQKIININIGKVSLKLQKTTNKQNKCSKSNLLIDKETKSILSYRQSSKFNKEETQKKQLKQIKQNNCILSNRKNDTSSMIKNLDIKLITQSQIEGRYKLNNKQEGIIFISEQDLQRFINKHAHQKLDLEEIIDKLQNQNQKYRQKQLQWDNFQKDSKEYIAFLEKQRFNHQNKCRQLQQQIDIFKDQHQYSSIAKEQYKNTINEQKHQISLLYQQIQHLQHRLTNKLEVNSCKNCDNKKYLNILNNPGEQSTRSKLLQIENNFLHNQLQINQKLTQKLSNYTSINKHKEQDQQIAHNRSFGEYSQLISANQLLTAQLKSLYIHKINAQIYKKTLEQYENQQKNEENILSLRGNKYSQINSQFNDEFRFDFSGGSGQQIEVVWRNKNKQNDGVKQFMLKSTNLQSCDFGTILNKQ